MEQTDEWIAALPNAPYRRQRTFSGSW